MKKIIPFILLITACGEPEVEPPSVEDTVYLKSEAFPQEEKSIYGTWMETSDIYEGEVSKRRWFYISRTEFGIGQWCFQGKLQNFSTVSGPAVAIDDTLMVTTDISAKGKYETPPCDVFFPKGGYGLNYDIKEDLLLIIFPQTGEILKAVRYYAPKGRGFAKK